MRHDRPMPMHAHAPPHRRHVAAAVCRWTLGLAVSAAACALAYFHAFGLPAGVLDRISRALSSESRHVRIGSARPALPPRLELRDVSVYLRGRIGPPAATARRVDISFGLGGAPAVDGVAIADAAITSIDDTLRLLQGSGAAPQAAHPSTAVSISALRVDAQGVWIERLAGGMSRADGVLTLNVQECALGRDPMRRGTAAGCASRGADGAWQAHATLKLDPSLVLPPLRGCAGGVADVLEAFTFRSGPPDVELSARFDGASRGPARADMTVRGRDFTFRGVEITEAEALIGLSLSNTNQVVDVRRLVAMRPGERIEAAFAIDDANHTVRYLCEARADPLAVAQLIDPDVKAFVGQFRFTPPVYVFAAGAQDTADPLRGSARGILSGSSLRIEGFAFDEFAFSVERTDRQVLITNVAASVFGGECYGDMLVVPDATGTNTTYRLRAELRDADFARLVRTAKLGEAKDHKGRLSGSLLLDGRFGPGAAVAARGAGEVAVRGGTIFRVPLFGGLSDLLGRVVPGLNWMLEQTDARADIAITNGVASTSNLRIEGDFFSLTGEGGYGFDGTLDLQTKFRLLKEKTLGGKVVHFLMRPVSNLFEFRLKGTIENYRWYPKHFSADLLKTLGLVGDHDAGDPPPAPPPPAPPPPAPPPPAPPPPAPPPPPQAEADPPNPTAQ